jgi:hypothetical protein
VRVARWLEDDDRRNLSGGMEKAHPVGEPYFL